jgi:carboxylesterase type B
MNSLMSGAPGVNFNTKSDMVSKNTEAVAEGVGCVEDGDNQSVATLNCLRNAPVDRLTNLSVSASRAARPPFGEGFFYPTYDGDFIPDRASQLVRAGKVAKEISVIASWVTNEGAWYAAPTAATDEEVLASFGLWLTNMSEATKSKLLELYPVDDFASMVQPNIDGPFSPQYYRAAQMNRDLWFTCPAIDFAWQYARHGGVNPSQVWTYTHNATRFAPAFAYTGVPMWRVAHLSDIPYVLNVQQLGGGADNSAAQLELAKIVSRSITGFVVSGIPDQVPGGTQSWPHVFDDPTRSELENDFPNKITLEVFEGLMGAHQQLSPRMPPRVMASRRERQSKA